jgi:hypothetical protein
MGKLCKIPRFVETFFGSMSVTGWICDLKFLPFSSVLAIVAFGLTGVLKILLQYDLLAIVRVSKAENSFPID